jgi:sugar (pentulose or hexulose) kinase
MFLGIDIGTLRVMAVTLDESGAVVAQGTAALSVSGPNPSGPNKTQLLVDGDYGSGASD